MTPKVFFLKALGRMKPILPETLNFRIRLALMQHTQPLEPELAELPRVLELLGVDHGLAVDVGANQGIWTFQLAKMFSKVITIEPNPSLAEGLKRLAPKNCRVFKEGVSNTPGNLDLCIPSVRGMALDGWASFDPENCPDATDLSRMPVPVRTLEAILDGAQPSFIKIDVEGHELQVLQGGEQIIRRSMPVMMIEVKEPRLPQVTSLLDGWGFTRKGLKELFGERPIGDNYFFIPTNNYQKRLRPFGDDPI